MHTLYIREQKRAYACIRRCLTEEDIDAGYTFSSLLTQSQGNLNDDKKDGGDDDDDNDDDDDRQCMCAVATIRLRQHFLFATKTSSLAPALFFRLFT